MNFKKLMEFDPYKFQYSVDIYVFVKGKKEIQDINK